MPHDPVIDAAIRRVPDFPRPGVLFYDLTSLLADPSAFRHTIDAVYERYRDSRIDAIAAIEARGFLLASPVAYRLGVPLILLRKPGKLPGVTLSRDFELEYGHDTVQIHRDDVPAGANVLVMDDLVATGGTVEAGCALIEEAGARVAGVCAIVELSFLPWRERLGAREVFALQSYDSE